jgi:hypothetical protein
MAQINTYSDISSLVNTVYEDAMLVARENSVMTALVKVFNDQRGMAVRKNTKYGSVTINQIGESDDLTSQAFTPSEDQTLTPYEYGAQYFITDSRRESDLYNVMNDAAVDLGQAMGVKVDSYLCGLFSSLTGGTVGAAGTNMSWGTFFSALAKMRRALAPRPWVCVLTPEQWACMGTAVAPGVTVTNSPYIQDEIVRQFFVNNVGGVDIFLDANIAVGTSVYGGMFSPPAIALDWRRAPRIEPHRKPSRRGDELNLSAVFAYGVWRPAFGVAINTAGTAMA